MEKKDREAVVIHMFLDLHAFNKLDSQVIRIISDHMGVDGKQLCQEWGIVYNLDK